ncbi:restriction endonuclease subunit S [Vibrio harveyi]|uniref:restriction endonuclease subunit S n=1 Tax=Vibrio harveyi TaxID=669 RepID=UPI00354F4C55
MSELPKGWIKATISEFARVESGVGFPKKYQGLNTKEIPVYKVGDISKSVQAGKPSLYESSNYVDESVRLAMKGKLYPVGSTLFAKIGEALKLNRRGYLSQSGLADNNVMGVVPDALVESKLLFYFLKTVDLSAFSRSSAVPSIRKGDVEELSYPLAPLAEQKRIVEKLDEVLAQVDTIKARLDGIPALLKRFRQSVLASAVSGKLTEEWRGGAIPKWEATVFSDICNEITVGFVGKMKDKYTDSGVLFLRSQNVRAFKYDPKNVLFISEEFHNEIHKSHLNAGDLAIVRSGAPGTTCVIPESLGKVNCSDLVIARPSERLNPKFGCIFMNSEVAQKNVASNQVGIAQQHFNVGSMKKMPIELPDLAEQQEIVRLVDQYFAFAETIEAQVKKAQARVDNLTQSILVKAFRGELVPQDPNDEPADKLLDRIAQARKEAEALAKAAKKAQSTKSTAKKKVAKSA